MEQLQQPMISGFSKLDKNSKLELILREYLSGNNRSKNLLQSFWHTDLNTQKIFDEFSENTLTNFYFPFGVVPNFILNNQDYCVPMVIEESSVVAACARSAKFWSMRGGFHAKTTSTKKLGQVHLRWFEAPELLFNLFNQFKQNLMDAVLPLEENMRQRGGGLQSLELISMTHEIENYYQIMAKFETCDAMGANFINTILEAIGREFKELIATKSNGKLEIIMAILSNYTPECLVNVWATCPVESLQDPSIDLLPSDFAQRIKLAADIASVDIHRATTHNKGIFNGVDAVVLATGNDFRAVEACGHTWAARDGRYRGLTKVDISEGQFKFELTLPMSLGTVGGLTSLHPLANFSLELLKRPSASELMQIAGAVGLAQNFAALRSLVTTGIQRGHMKMHLINILKHLEASETEATLAKVYFADNVVSFKAVREFLAQKRQYH
jgi:hydroxymethylglutaryl-CoA reductase